MGLTRADQERLRDSRLKIQSVVSALNGITPDKVPDYAAIQECLEDAENSLRLALRAGEPDS